MAALGVGETVVTAPHVEVQALGGLGLEGGGRAVAVAGDDVVAKLDLLHRIEWRAVATTPGRIPRAAVLEIMRAEAAALPGRGDKEAVLFFGAETLRDVAVELAAVAAALVGILALRGEAGGEAVGLEGAFGFDVHLSAEALAVHVGRGHFCDLD